MITPRQGVSGDGLDELARHARAAAKHAHAPYSRQRVGAALRTAQGGLFLGCNVENASYGLTMCAERNAIAAAIAAEGADMRLAALVCVVAGRKAFPPCGACRQVIAEFAEARTPVAYSGRGGVLVRTTLGALLPQAFRLQDRTHAPVAQRTGSRQKEEPDARRREPAR